MNKHPGLEKAAREHPEKFVPTEVAFSRMHWGDRIFVGTGCGEPQHLLSEFVKYVRANPKALMDAEVVQIWAQGDVPYMDAGLRESLRHNSFFIGRNVRDAVNSCLADYTPVPLGDVPDLIRRDMIPIDVAMVQAAPPDGKGEMNLGVSVDVSKEAAKKASLLIVQVNGNMPRVNGDGVLHIDEADYLIPFDEPLIEYGPKPDVGVTRGIGSYVSRLVHDGETIQIGYGSIMDGIAPALQARRDLGIHTELFSDGLADLMRTGAANNSKKSVNTGKTVAAFCMGSRHTYEFINGNDAVEFRTIDYTDDPRVVARHDNMTAINGAFAIDLTGQATSESVGRAFYGGVGGQPSFMRGAALAKNGKSILVVQSTAEDGTVSRIMPSLPEGAGVTLNRGDVHYVVSEYGIAYLHGKTVRERALELLSIAHPGHRRQLLEAAKRLNLVYADQAFVPGKNGVYPGEYEAYRTTHGGLSIHLRPVKISDEQLLKDFFYSLSDESMYHRFASAKKGMLHASLQDYTAVDYNKRMIILATFAGDEQERVAGMGQYAVDEKTHTGELAFVVRDEYHNRGVGTQLLRHLTYIARKKGLLGFSAEVLNDNSAMIRLFKEAGYVLEKKAGADMCQFKKFFGRRQ